ncbi:unnamed protein product [Cochlearia groenlandica]
MGMERNNNLLSPTNLTSPNKCKFMTLTLNSVISFKQFVSISFMIENGMTKPGKITLLGRDGTRWLVSLREEVVSRRLVFSKGWSMFSKANGLNEIGESFTFELIYENGTPLLCLLNKDSSSYDRSLIGECSKPAESSNVNKNRFMTLHVDLFRESTQHVSMSFMKDNNIHVPGKITLLGKDGSRWRVNLREKNRQRMILSKGWKNFAQANGLINTEKSFTFELIYENGTPLLCLLNKDSTSYDRSLILIGKYVKAAEPPSSSRTKKREDKRESCSTIIGRFVTLTLTHEDVEDCILNLPSEFLKANGINKLGKMTIFGENGTEWSAYLLTKNGFVALGDGWYEFCEANGVKLGESFTLESIYEQDNITHALKFCPL